MEVKKRKSCELDIKENTRLLSNIILLLFGRLVSLFGSQIYTFAIGLYVLKTTGSGTAFSGTLIFGMLPRIIFGPIAGIIADRVDRKRMVVSMDILSGLVVFGLVAISSIKGLKLPYIYIANLLLNTFNTFFDVPFTASIPNIVDDKSLMKTNSFNQSITSIAQIGGPFIGGLIFAFVDMKLFLTINAASFIFSGISEMFIDFNYNKGEKEKKEEVQNKKEKGKNLVKGFGKEFIEGFSFLKGKTTIFILSIFAVFLNFFVCFGIDIPYPYIINNVVKLSSTQFGILEGTFPLGMLIGSLLMVLLPERKKKYKSLISGIMVMNVLIIMIGIPIIPRFMIFNKNSYFIYFAVISFIVGMSNVYINLPISVIMQREIPDNVRGRIFGLMQTICMAISPLGMILSGALIDRIAVWIIPVLSGIVLIILTFIMALNKEIKQI
ncbi:MFS transporter [Clostridium ganghwense]|uniref:MFS transporter n=1 Tax=Clostridium ganghwense TaxID=312089 RepID=A0ABT4CR04_9CLOT|nr:MFS transporter [Clostridium ganghwense]MCY6371498.1 MFS transporter [Clostridium ganghwense]